MRLLNKIVPVVEIVTGLASGNLYLAGSGAVQLVKAFGNDSDDQSNDDDEASLSPDETG